MFRFKRNMSSDPDALERLRNAEKIVDTPCKNLPGQRASSYDDRFILDLADKYDGVVISRDNYADLLNEKPSEYSTGITPNCDRFLFAKKKKQTFFKKEFSLLNFVNVEYFHTLMIEFSYLLELLYRMGRNYQGTSSWFHI